MAEITEIVLHMGFCFDVRQAVDVDDAIQDKKLSIDSAFRHRFADRTLYTPLSLAELTSVREEGLFVMEHDGKPCYIVKELEVMFPEIPAEGMKYDIDHLCDLYGKEADWIEVRSKVLV